MAMDREYELVEAVACGASLAATDAVDMRSFAGASLIIPDASTITLLTLYGYKKDTGTFLALFDEDHVAVTMVVAANQVCTVPSAAYGCHWVKFVGNFAGTVDVMKKG